MDDRKRPPGNDHRIASICSLSRFPEVALKIRDRGFHVYQII
jgi:hypothetical protein